MTYKKSSFFPQTQIFVGPPPSQAPDVVPLILLLHLDCHWLFPWCVYTFVLTGEKRTIELFHDILIFHTHTHFTNAILVS